MRLSSDTIGHWAELFDLFDEDASGALSKKELECLFDVLGIDKAWVFVERFDIEPYSDFSSK